MLEIGAIEPGKMDQAARVADQIVAAEPDIDGHYINLVRRPELPKFVSNNRIEGTADENKAVVIGTNAHYGKYTVQGDATVFSIDRATFPTGMARRRSASTRSRATRCGMSFPRRRPAAPPRSSGAA